MTELTLETILLRLVAASLLPMLVGWEREAKEKPAGLKTHTLVGIGAAGFYLIFVEFTIGPLKDAEGISPDPMRVIEGVVTGIGFLGAGAIIQAGTNVTGITTGAGIWISGAIGLACGAGYFVIAGLVTLFTLLVLLGLGWAERQFFSQHRKDDGGA